LIYLALKFIQWKKSCSNYIYRLYVSCHGLQCPMVRLFNIQSHLKCLNNIPINGEVGWFFKVVINPPLEVLALRYGRFNNILSNVPTNKKQYEITIEYFQTCIFLGFVSMVASLLGQWKKWVPYKHLYYVLQIVMFLGNLKFSFISPLVMKCVICWIVL